MVTPAGALALEMLVGGETILNLARDVSDAFDAAGVEGGVVGGIAVFLHGYERTTTDIDVYTTDRRKLADELERRGWVWSDERRQFEKDNFPCQILAPEDNLPWYPTRFGSVREVRTVTLGDLISMKLSSGTKFVHRSQDVADVVRLIQFLDLDKSFTPRVAPAYRHDFKRLVDSIDRERREGSIR